jgi:hypothetical protein
MGLPASAHFTTSQLAWKAEREGGAGCRDGNENGNENRNKNENNNGNKNEKEWG